MPNRCDAPQVTDNFIEACFKRTKPSMACEATTPDEVWAWRDALKDKIRELLGAWPEPADLSPQLHSTEETECFRREKWLIQTERDCWMPLYLLVPRNAQGRLPAILCCHGHGTYGKDPVAGVTAGRAGVQQSIDSCNYNYGEQMARRGYVTICPDWRSFGERVAYNDSPFGGRDKCNIHFLQHLLLGQTLLGANIFDGRRALDFLLTRDEVDPERLGCMGLSQGGTMTTYITLLDERIKAADIICYATTTGHYAIHRPNVCGSQLVPFLYRYADVGDVMAAICPRPLLIESGANDTCFWLHSAQAAHDKIRRAYTAAGAEANLTIEVFPGEHAFAGGKAFDFFDRHL